MKFNRLTVIGIDKEKHRFICKCVCGKIVSPRKYELMNGNTQSCGCLRIEMLRSRVLRHGACINRKINKTWRVWASMRERCLHKKCKDYPSYGGRGITVYEKWNTFENFLLDMGECPAGLTLDRIDNNKGYEPGNCRWVTHIEQMRNRRPVLEWKLIPLRGSLHPSAKLTDLQVIAIRKDNRKHRLIAEDYNITRRHVTAIKLRAIWKHINTEE